jgi:hypothetical protein
VRRDPGAAVIMIETAIIWSLLIFHIISCVIALLLIKSDRLRISMQLYFLAVFHPVWGIIMLFNADRRLKAKKTGSREIQLEKLSDVDDSLWIVPVTDDDDESSVVPLEEAFVINNQETRRKLMIDMLQQNPQQYIDLLQKARVNDDIEVTHYATTAIMEIQREFELQLKRTESAYRESPNRLEVLENYLFALRDYIKSGLMQDSLLYMQRQKLDLLLGKRLGMENPTPEIYSEAIDNLLEMRILERPHELLLEALNKWPRSEELWMMKLKWQHLAEDGKGIKQTIAEIKDSKIHLSFASQQKLAFWGR